MTKTKQQAGNRKTEKRYDARKIDYEKMVAQHKIGDGHRDARGYHCPGSRKKVGG